MEISITNLDQAAGGILWMLPLAIMAIAVSGCAGVTGSASCTATASKGGADSISCTAGVEGQF